MSIRESEPGAWEKVDLETLDGVEKRARGLFLKGPIPFDVWRDLWTAAVKAADNQADALHTLRMYRPEGWEPDE